MKGTWATTTLAVLALTVPATAHAQATADPAGDLLSTFTGASNANLDFTSAQASFNGSAFLLDLSLAGPVGTGTPNLLHVWGINRGAGTPRLNIGFDPDIQPILFDSLAVLFNDSTLRVVTFPSSGAPTITNMAGGALISGNTISASVPLSLLPSRGFAPADYTFQLWSRSRSNPLADGPNTEIADIGPLLVASVPEPATWAMMIVGFGLIGGTMRRASRKPLGALAR